MKVLVTGGSGFVGQALTSALTMRMGIEVRTTVRDAERSKGPAEAVVFVADLSPHTDWSKALAGVEVIAHTAARVDKECKDAPDTLLEYRRVNVDGTLNLARQAAAAGIKRFIFLSSIKVNGEGTEPGCAYTADDVAAPVDAYGISKAEAEVGLRLLSQETSMEVVVIRSPLVYGPRVKGNFYNLLRWVARGLPLPLGAATANRRSLVSLDNLVDLILTCVNHPRAANQTFLVSDGEDLSTADLLRRIGSALNQPACLLPVPVSILRFTSRLLGKTAMVQRLLGSLQVDINKTCALLDWLPPVSVDEGLRRAAQKRL